VPGHLGALGRDAEQARARLGGEQGTTWHWGASSARGGRTPFVNRLPFGADMKEDIENRNPRICRGPAPRAQTLVCESRP
jgi:hypothetical protein